MSWFGKKIRSSTDTQKVLTAAKELLKTGTTPEPSIRGAVSQAMKDLGFSDSKIGQVGEISVTTELRTYGDIPADDANGIETWGKTAGLEAIQKAFERTIPCLNG